jgi:O-acetyl-ADP-ribose deacetylase (regulator of RNase III)
MRGVRQLAVVLLLFVTVTGVRAGDVIDRIVATVGRHAILQSEVDEAVRFETFAAGRPLASVTIEDVKSALNRIVDQQLIRDDMGETDSFAPSNEDVKKRVAEIRSQVAGGATEEGWRAVLGAFGLTEAVVADRVKAQLETIRMVNQRLRPGVRVDQAEVEAAYRDEFLPKLRQAGAKEVPLAEVSTRIRQILVERHIGELMDGWLESLRAQNEIRIELDEIESAGPKTAPTAAGGVPQGASSHQ